MAQWRDLLFFVQLLSQVPQFLFPRLFAGTEETARDSRLKRSVAQATQKHFAGHLRVASLQPRVVPTQVVLRRHADQRQCRLFGTRELPNQNLFLQ